MSHREPGREDLGVQVGQELTRAESAAPGDGAVVDEDVPVGLAYGVEELVDVLELLVAREADGRGGAVVHREDRPAVDLVLHELAPGVGSPLAVEDQGQVAGLDEARALVGECDVAVERVPGRHGVVPFGLHGVSSVTQLSQGRCRAVS